MAKGLTTVPLMIWVAPQWFAHPAVLDLMRQGHRVVRMRTNSNAVDENWCVGEPDLILHPAAHAWTDAFWDYLPAAITAARRRKRERP